MNVNWSPEKSNEWEPGERSQGQRVGGGGQSTINQKIRGIYELVINCQYKSTKWACALIINTEEEEENMHRGDQTK